MWIGKRTFMFAKTKVVCYQPNQWPKLWHKLDKKLNNNTKPGFESDQPDNNFEVIKCTKLCLLFYFLILNSQFSILFSQTLIPTVESAFEPQLPFDDEYIKAQRIKSITFDIIDKKDFQVAEDKGLLNYYEFNDQGQITRFYYTSIAKVIQKEYHSGPVYHHKRKVNNGHSYTKNEYIYDTISTNYYYNEKFLLKLKRYNDGSYYESYYYDYSLEGKIKQEKRCK